MSIPCPACHKTESTVTDTRRCGDGIRRRRKCYRCGARFWTVETILPAKPRRLEKVEAAG